MSQLETPDPQVELGFPSGLEDPAVLSRLHREVLQIAAPDAAHGLLYGVGFVQGMVDGLRVARAFSEVGHPGACVAAPRIPLLLPLGRSAEGRGVGSLLQSSEASEQLERLGYSAGPVCHVGVGYASGWYSALRRETWLVRERECRARGDRRCRFEARRVEDWLERDEAWTRGLLPFLDFDRVSERLAEADPDESLELTPEGDLVGALEPMSPAIHVWGPVLVLPYAGAADGEAALDAVAADPEGEEIRVVIVDVLGARLDGVESVGLASLVARVRRRGIEVIVAGRRTSRGLAPLAEGLETRDVTAGIALAFQLCGG
jgi:hypothetical protein